MNFKRYHVSRNLFDYSTITTGYRIQWATGNDYADATAVRSDYIPVNAGTYSCSDNTIVLGYDTNKNYLGATDGNGVFEKSAKIPTTQFTILANSDCKYIKILSFYNAQTPMNIDAETMLNTGSTVLPYEPYSSEVWHNTPHYIMGTSEDTITTLPAVLYPNGTTATVGLKGNASQQSGTTTVPSKSVTVSSLESGTNYALFPKADFPDAVVGDTINIVVSGTSYSQKVMKIDTSYVYIENRTV